MNTGEKIDYMIQCLKVAKAEYEYSVDYLANEPERDYTERNPKMHYSVDDFIKLYHEPTDSMHWNGIRATKGLYEMYGINGRTTAMRNGAAGNDSTRQDWGM